MSLFQYDINRFEKNNQTYVLKRNISGMASFKTVKHFILNLYIFYKPQPVKFKSRQCNNEINPRNSQEVFYSILS